jgi:hypothetical protein
VLVIQTHLSTRVIGRCVGHSDILSFRVTGHLLAGTIKDTVTRYAHQTGHHVVRRFGWDCHGLPVEFEIDTQLGIKTRDQVGFG